jgi:hypothetical protein
VGSDAGGPDPARITDVAGFVREVDLLRRQAARGTGKARVGLTELAGLVAVPRSTVHAYVSGKLHPRPTCSTGSSSPWVCRARRG